jgi:hypothetical protein
LLLARRWVCTVLPIILRQNGLLLLLLFAFIASSSSLLKMQ